MALPDEPWSTSFPTSQDTPGTEQPDLTPDSSPGAEDGHRILVSHLHTLRDKLQAMAMAYGDDSNLPSGCTRAKVATLESAPPSHASSHEPGGGDAMTVDAAAGTGSLRTLGTGSTNACAGDDSRLSDARTPTSHASTHQSGGGDAIKLDDLATPDDNTDLNVSTSAHGLCPKAPDDAKQVLLGDASFGDIPDINPAVGSTVKYYIDGTAGSDVTGDGAAWGTAYATFDHVWNNVLPAVLRDLYVIQFRNTGAVSAAGPNSGTHGGKVFAGIGAGLALVGEDGYNTTASPGPFTSGDTMTGVRTGAGWTIDEHAGKWVRITSGANVNQIRGVIENTTDTLYFNEAFGTGLTTETWEWVEPKSTVEGALSFSIVAATPTCYGVRISHLQFDETAWAYVYNAPWQLRNVQKVLGARGEAINSMSFKMDNIGINPATGADDTSGDGDYGGKGGTMFSNTGTNGDLWLEGYSVDSATCFWAKTMSFFQCQMAGNIGGGTNQKSRVSKTPTSSAWAVLFERSDCVDATGLNNLEVDALSAGSDCDSIRFDRSKGRIHEAVTLSNFKRHGIHAVNSQIVLHNTAPAKELSGTGDTGSSSGMKIRWNSACRIGIHLLTEPTLSGDGGGVHLRNR